jgi:ParB family chromosome partitioning protein
MFAFICYVSIHLEISATVVRSAPEELPKHRRKATIANTTGLRVLTAIAAAVQMRLMKLDLLFVVKRVGFLSDENRLTWFCRGEEVRAKKGLM